MSHMLGEVPLDLSSGEKKGGDKPHDSCSGRAFAWLA